MFSLLVWETSRKTPFSRLVSSVDVLTMLCFFHKKEKKFKVARGFLLLFLVQITKKWQSTLKISKAAHPPIGPQKGMQLELGKRE